jgi:hypothetical protein
MPHLIPFAEIEHLATLDGVARLDEWQRQLKDAEDRIRTQLRGSIRDAWDCCFPTRLDLGRVRDLSRAVRVPKYWPSYANLLGSAFTNTYRNECRFLIDLLHTMPVETHEYLCACDLLEIIAFDLAFDDDPSVNEIYALTCQIPTVLFIEVKNDARFSSVKTVGAFIRQSWRMEWGDDNAGQKIEPQVNLP